MLSLDNRIDLLDKLGAYMRSDSEEWLQAQDSAVNANAWFTPEGIKNAAENIAIYFLERNKLEAWVANYRLPATPRIVGIVMAGNIPLVGFHDFLCGFIAGHNLMLKLSTKDDVLMTHIVAKLTEWQAQVAAQVQISEMLKGCDAYIATGSNNTARYFEQYFARFPHLIRKNRTSIAILDGTETEEQLVGLSSDIFSYFGLGCRNVTQVNVPRGYDLTKLMVIFDRYKDVIYHNKYKNNYDYYLAIYLLNKVHHYTNDAILLVENELPFSAVAVLHYRYYDDKTELANSMIGRDDIQCIVGNGYVPFGSAQRPQMMDYPDGVDTMAFLCGL